MKSDLQNFCLSHLLELVLEPVGVHLEAVARVDLLDEGGHAELAELVQLVFLAQGDQLLGDVVDADAVGVKILDQGPDGAGGGVKGNAKSLGALQNQQDIEKRGINYWHNYSQFRQLESYAWT